MEQLVSARTLADHLELTEETIRELARRKTIPSIKVGHRVRFRISDVVRRLEGETK
jgi:excisionase family DNA binding protein